MSKGLSIFLISITVFAVTTATVLGIVFFVLGKDDEKDKELTIDDMNEYSFETAEITTDLMDGRFVRVQFRVITDGKDALKEVEKRDFQIENILIKELSAMEEEDFTTGLDQVEQTLQTKMNEIMTEGQIVEVYTVRKILQ
jgi:flagellar FliL protein